MQECTCGVCSLFSISGILISCLYPNNLVSVRSVFYSSIINGIFGLAPSIMNDLDDSEMSTDYGNKSDTEIQQDLLLHKSAVSRKGKQPQGVMERPKLKSIQASELRMEYWEWP